MKKVITIGLSCLLVASFAGCSAGDIADGEESIDQVDLGANSKPFSVRSLSFEDGAAFPPEFTCEGNPFATGVSPKLKWKDEPKDTKSFAIVFRDTTPPDVNFQYHWAMWNIRQSGSTLPDGIPGLIPGSTEIIPLPESLHEAQHVQARGIPRFFAPCPSNQTTLAQRCGLPPVPPVTDTYTFTVYALTVESVTVPPHNPAIHPNYVYRLDQLFQSMTDADHRAVMTATSSAVPSTVPFPCPPPAP